MEKKILLAVDGSDKGFSAVSIVANLLKDQSDLNLVVFHCVQQLARLYPGELCEIEETSLKLPAGEQEKAGNAVLQEAYRILVEAGVPKSRIQLKLKTESTDPARDVLAEAEAGEYAAIALGRRGRSQLETLLLGSVSSKVAQYATHKTVWIVDTPVHQTQKVLVAMEGAPDSRTLTQYAADMLAKIPQLEYTFLHVMPPVPPTFWDDGHILASTEQKDRESRIDRWRADWTQRVEKFLAEARSSLVARKVPGDKVETLILPAKEGIARDLLNEVDEHKFQVVVMGKKSFHERKPFLLGSHAQKILQNAKGAILCLVDG